MDHQLIIKNSKRRSCCCSGGGVGSFSRYISPPKFDTDDASFTTILNFL